jgi:hypothetical protein
MVSAPNFLGDVSRVEFMQRVCVDYAPPHVNMGACLLRGVGHKSYAVVVAACISHVHAVVRG